MQVSHVHAAVLMLLFSTALAYDFCKDNKDVLTKYRIYNQFNGDEPNKKLSVENNLPLLWYEKSLGDRKLGQSWLINMCGNEIDTSSSSKIDLEKYTQNSLLYVSTKIDSSDIYTEVVNILNSDLSSEKVTLSEMHDEFTGLNVYFKEQNNNNYNLTFSCDTNLKIDEFTKINKAESYDIVSQKDLVTWDILLRGPSGCFTNSKDNKPVRSPPVSGKSHSVFLYFFIYVLIFTSIYIGATSYLEIKDGGTLQDFEDTFKHKFKELIFSIPAFSKELYNKIVGNSSSRYNPAQFGSSDSSTNRGGYAAV